MYLNLETLFHNKAACKVNMSDLSEFYYLFAITELKNQFVVFSFLIIWSIGLKVLSPAHRPSTVVSSQLSPVITKITISHFVTKVLYSGQKQIPHTE